MFLSIVAPQLATANMLSPAAMDTFDLGFSSSPVSHSMYLGQWSHKISAKLMPSYYNRLSNISTNNTSIEITSALQANYVTNSTAFSTSLFASDAFLDQTTFNFSFSTETNQLSQNAINTNFVNSGNLSGTRSHRISTPPTIIKQEFYSPGYTLTSGNNSFSVNALLVQQKFSDNYLSTARFQTAKNHSFFASNDFYSVNRGTGYNLKLKRNFIANSYINIEYNSKIRMHEFGSLGKSYSDSGNFDIPQKYSLALGLQLLDKNNIEFSAEKISYSQVDVNSHGGYLDYFRNHVNSFLRPNKVSLNDLTIYSVKFEQNLNENLSWNIDVSSNQQATTSSLIYNNALEKDTADYSYKIGMSQLTSLGQFTIFASLANKPILIGTTDFGRFANTSLGQHVEGVVSWNFAF